MTSADRKTVSQAREECCCLFSIGAIAECPTGQVAQTAEHKLLTTVVHCMQSHSFLRHTAKHRAFELLICAVTLTGQGRAGPVQADAT